MNDISKIAEVIGVATKKDGSELRGIGKNGKEWVMYQVILENGVKMNTFGPVSVGDIMFNLTQDEKYHNWKGELKRQGNGQTPATSTQPNMGQPTNAQIFHKLEEIEAFIHGNRPDDNEPMPVKTVTDVVLTAEDFDEAEPINLAEIPFN